MARSTPAVQPQRAAQERLQQPAQAEIPVFLAEQGADWGLPEVRGKVAPSQVVTLCAHPGYQEVPQAQPSPVTQTSLGSLLVHVLEQLHEHYIHL